MLTEKILQIALIASILVHATILFQNFNLFKQNTNKKNQENIEINYLKDKREIKQRPKINSQANSPAAQLPRNPKAKRLNPPAFIDTDKINIFEKNQETTPSPAAFTKPNIIKSDIMAIKKKITMPPIGLDKIKNPSYISYYQIVREKIKRAAYQNYMHTETGEVFMSFLISAEGYLGQVKIIEDKSSPNVYLRETALKSIKDASPFPNFPAELNYSELSFNVVISFEID